MKDKKKLWGILFALCSVIFFATGFESRAEEVSGEQTISQEEVQNGDTTHSEEITMMDENGNITVIGDTDGTVESSGIAAFSRSTPVQVVNFNTKNGAVTNYTEYDTGAAGYTNGDYGADAAYLGTENGKVKFMLSGVVGLVSASEVQIVNLTDCKAVSYYIVQNGRLWHRIVHNLNQSGYISALDQGPAPSYLTAGQEYYSYDGHYFYVDYATMLEDYCNETRANSENPNNPHYNYYQYLPLRSTMTYSEATLTSLVNAKLSSGSKMQNMGATFVDHQNTYGVNALIMTGIAANESAWGISSIAKNKNNLFGLNAVDTSPGTSANTYASVSECIRQFAETYMSKRYLRPGYTYYHGAFLGNKASGINVSYASDPYWGEKAANAVWTLDKNGGSKDCGTYTIGIKDTLATEHNSVNVRNGSSTAKTALYKTGKWTSYAVLLQNETKENGFYKIQSDGVLNSGRTAIDTSSGKYNIGSMYAYISADYVTIVNDGQTIETPSETTKTLSSIYISKAPTKTSYTDGDTFDATGMVVKAKWSDNTETDVTKSVKYSSSALKAGATSIQISYTYGSVTKTVSQKITVQAKATTSTASYTKYKLIAGGVNYRSGPGTSYAVKGTLAKNTQIDVENGYSKTANGYTWYRFKLNGNNYYIASKYVQKIEDTSSTTTPTSYAVYKTTTKVNYRTGPGTSYSKGGTFVAGKQISIEEGYSKTANGYTWYRFKLNSKNYYIASKYVQKVSTSSTSSSEKLVNYVTTTSVNYRTGAGMGNTIVGTLTKGTTVQVVDGWSITANNIKWCKIKMNGKYYYMASAYLKSASSSGSTTSEKLVNYKTTTSVNYRTGAGMGYKIVATLAKGTTVQVVDGWSTTANNIKWCKIKMNGKYYYMASVYLKKS